jgi:hypothetical protein
MQLRYLHIFTFLVILLIQHSCTKVVVYSRDVKNDAVTRSYRTDVYTAMEQTQRALEALNYKVLLVQEGMDQMKTGWRPTPPDSHYFSLFGRKDYSGNAGVYYQVIVDFVDDGTQVKVSVYTQIKSLVGKLKSSFVIEKKVLAKLDDFLRSPQIEINNVGVTER